MPRHLEKRIVPYTPEQMFALVADIENYPAFLPWCLGAEITERGQDQVRADLVVGHRALRDRFTSHVRFEKPRRIIVSYGGGPLTHLSNEWCFEPQGTHACLITFFVDFRFKSGLLGAMMDVFFDRAFSKMVTAFERRAAELYGPN